MRAITLRVFSSAFLIILFVSVVHAQKTKAPEPAPIPPQIAAARKVFISNAGGDSVVAFTGSETFDGGPDRPYNEFYAAMKSWGKYQIVSSPSQSDLIFEINWTLGDAQLKAPVLGELRLTIIDARMGVALWSFMDYVQSAFLLSNRDKNLDAAMNELVGAMKAQQASAGPATQ